MINKTNDIKR